MYLPPLFTAWRQTLSTGYKLENLRHDIIAGITVGVIAIPLAMALAIAVGVPPQHGLYTVLIGGFFIALLGGSRFNVSGPTAAFVVILVPITQQFGVGGLLLCTSMAGAIMILMSVLRAGSLLQFIPYPVVLGFTAGIGIVIATLQIKDALGLTHLAEYTNYLEQLQALFFALPSIQWGDTLVTLITLATLLIWPRYVSKMPGHLVAILLGTLLAVALKYFGVPIATIGERFSYEVNGQTFAGIPSFLPSFLWPWELTGSDGQSLLLNFELIRQLLAPAFAIAMLGAIESLLCAVVADGMTNTKHNSNGELLAQGIGNIITPMFGGITATAAIARTAANVRAGAFSPLAGMTHALVVLGAMLLLAPLFSYLPMASMAALLLVVAWNMSEPKNVLRTLRIAPRNDILILLTCLVLTVLFDMVLAVGVGLLLAAGLFIKRMSDLTDTSTVSPEQSEALRDMPEGVITYAIRGPLFYGAAERALSVLMRFNPNAKVVLIDMSAVPMLDMTALSGLEKVMNNFHKNDISVILVGTSTDIRKKMRKAGIRLRRGKLSYVQDLTLAKERATRWLHLDTPNDELMPEEQD
ncbi:C4-dicarboxylic acid transporter DauA [Pseudomonas sp. F1_0610]|uniref:C4-dicarboxylic acid transporter DauA n=1 Tax=Pseudomonas sp. F1_0610 TaxID=3114284 RepID=UPI0039C2D977